MPYTQGGGSSSHIKRPYLEDDQGEHYYELSVAMHAYHTLQHFCLVVIGSTSIGGNIHRHCKNI